MLKVKKAKCALIQGKCWCNFELGVLAFSIFEYPDGYSGEYHSLVDTFVGQKNFLLEISWQFLKKFLGKGIVGMVDVGPMVLITYTLPIVVDGEIFSRTHNQSNTVVKKRTRWPYR